MDSGMTPHDARRQDRSYCSHADLVGVADVGRDVEGRPVQILDAPHVILTELWRVGIAVERRHHGARLQGVLQAQHVAKLVSCHLQKIHPFTGERSQVNTVWL